jgi:SAM-dependent methyltransferase
MTKGPDVALEAWRASIRARSTLPKDETERILAARFSSIPNRLAFGLETWPLRESAVLDVGCAYGHCLAHFGPGSMGVDNVSKHVLFCRSLGLEACLLDVDGGLEVVPDARFDYAWVSDIVEHVDAPRLLLRRLIPKLKPEGRLLLYVTALPRSRVARVTLNRLQISAFRASTHHYQFTYETVRFLVERAGFRVETVAVPALRGRRRWLAPFLRTTAPTLILEATPDRGADSFARKAEQKNKPELDALKR